MAGRQPEQPPREHFACEYCDAVWPTSRELASHIKAHGKAPVQEVPLPPVPPGFGPGPGMLPVLPPSFFLPPPPPPPVMALGQPVAPAGFFGGLRRVQVRQPLAPPLRDPVVFSDAGGRIRMVVLEPNHGFWTLYRMGMDPPVEIDFMGLRSRPESPSPSFASWLNA